MSNSVQAWLRDEYQKKLEKKCIVEELSQNKSLKKLYKFLPQRMAVIIKYKASRTIHCFSRNVLS